MWKILLVDDEELAVEMLEDTLYDSYEVYKASSGEEALKVFKQTPGIGMVISDQRMPGMTGIELFKELKQLKPDLSCILLTGYSSLEDTIDAINSNLLNRYLHKPWEEHELLSIVEQEYQRLDSEVEKKQLQNKLIEQGENFRNLTDSLPEAFIVFDQNYKIKLLNPVAENHFARPEHHSLLDIIDENSKEKIVQALQDLDQKNGVNLEIALRDKNQHFVSCAASITTFHQNGETTFALIARDITSHINYEKSLEKEVLIQTEGLKKALQQAEEASIAKSQFLSNISHEIRTPLNAIIGFTEIIKHTELNENQKEFFEHITSCSNILLKLINSILSISKIESGKLQLNEEDFDLGITLKEVFHSLPYKENVKLSFPALPEGSIVHGDSMHLEQILINLVGNALKFTSEGEVSVKMDKSEKDGKIRLDFSISDTGIGISKEQQQKIFDAFVQEDSSTTRHYGGTGLGLSIVKKLIDMMDGDIEVTSEKGKGTTFKFFVHFKASGAPESLAPEVKEERPPILVIEDNHYNILLMQTILDQLKENYEIASYGPSGLSMAMESKYRLIFMDLQIPGMDGLEITRQLRKAGKKLPIVAVTANIFQEDKDSCLQSGMNDFIAKPVTLEKISEAIQKYTS